MRYNWSQRLFLIFHRMRELRESHQAARKKNQAAGKENLAASRLMFTASRLSRSSLNLMSHERLSGNSLPRNKMHNGSTISFTECTDVSQILFTKFLC